jgi:mannitol/fructose-specific phosphotransferase system IIA component (Ntr-type)
LRIIDYLDIDSVRVGLEAEDKASTLDRMVGIALERKLVHNRKDLTRALHLREEVVSTGIGRGIAIPHADLPEIEAPKLILGIFPEGVDFDSLDDEPVHLVFLLLGTPRTPELHMKILARIARLSRDSDFTEGLPACRTVAEVLSILERVEARH